MQEKDGKTAPTRGSIIEALPNATFRVQLEDEREVVAYLSGKIRMNRIRVLVGDKVELVLDDYGKRGRITRRL